MYNFISKVETKTPCRLLDHSSSIEQQMRSGTESHCCCDNVRDVGGVDAMLRAFYLCGGRLAAISSIMYDDSATLQRRDVANTTSAAAAAAAARDHLPPCRASACHHYPLCPPPGPSLFLSVAVSRRVCVRGPSRCNAGSSTTHTHTHTHTHTVGARRRRRIHLTLYCVRAYTYD